MIFFLRIHLFEWKVGFLSFFQYEIKLKVFVYNPINSSLAGVPIRFNNGYLKVLRNNVCNLDQFSI